MSCRTFRDSLSVLYCPSRWLVAVNCCCISLRLRLASSRSSWASSSSFERRLFSPRRSFSSLSMQTRSSYEVVPVSFGSCSFESNGVEWLATNLYKSDSIFFLRLNNAISIKELGHCSRLMAREVSSSLSESEGLVDLGLFGASRSLWVCRHYLRFIMNKSCRQTVVQVGKTKD